MEYVVCHICDPISIHSVIIDVMGVFRQIPLVWTSDTKESAMSINCRFSTCSIMSYYDRCFLCFIAFSFGLVVWLSISIIINLRLADKYLVMQTLDDHILHL